ncbi:methyltransferase domain-containing protein [Paenibacillus sp. PL2-23]|uniref:class I SAM-dependent methyltransferase n=1 Tax=Paenibacillus sp. PL2-23 TaxID=2100729 RepID=UPI0030F87AB2
MNSMNQWQPDEYDHQLGFISEYGMELLDWLQPKRGESILDLGCGTGDLTFEIAQSGASVMGMDASVDMIRRAKEKIPDILFHVGDGQQFNVDIPMDAVFSNAAFHWMKDAEGVLHSVWQALKPGGRLVAEFGGKDNVKAIVNAMTDVLTAQYGIDAASRNPWFFPSLAQYCQLLESQGFTVRAAHYFERPTRLPEGRAGMLGWLAQFGDDFFQGLSQDEIHAACSRISDKAMETLSKGDEVYADYRRLRVIAEKPINK